MDNSFLNIFILIGAAQIVVFMLLKKRNADAVEDLTKPQSHGAAPVKLRTARPGLRSVRSTANEAPGEPVAMFPGLPQTHDELRHALRHARGVQRQRIIDRLTELEEEQYDNCMDVSFLDGFATDQEILEDLR